MIDLLAHIERNALKRAGLRRDVRILIAVSGGVDSMTLLHVLAALAPKLGWKLCVAHFNHRLRGRSSAADERLVRRCAKALKLTCKVGQGDVRQRAHQSRESIEMAARILRHDFLARAAKEFRASAIALAHHADDQVELFFLRVLRGAGGLGLGGMKWRSPSSADSAMELVRPLLDLTKAELEQYARAAGVPFRKDATNDNIDLLRNRIRHDLLPKLRREYEPGLDRTVSRLMEIVGTEAESVTEGAQAWRKDSRGIRFEKLSVGLQRRILQLQLFEHGIQPNFEWIERLRDFPNQRITVGLRTYAIRDAAGNVEIERTTDPSFEMGELELDLGSKPGAAQFDGIRIVWNYDTRRTFDRGKVGRECEGFDADRIGARILLRHWRPGDRFQPLGSGHGVKLQDWFVNRKVPRDQRHRLAVALTTDGRIFWVEGQRIAEGFQLTSETKKRLIWAWKRG